MAFHSFSLLPLEYPGYPLCSRKSGIWDCRCWPAVLGPGRGNWLSRWETKIASLEGRQHLEGGLSPRGHPQLSREDGFQWWVKCLPFPWRDQCPHSQCHSLLGFTPGRSPGVRALGQTCFLKGWGHCPPLFWAKWLLRGWQRSQSPGVSLAWRSPALQGGLWALSHV